MPRTTLLAALVLLALPLAACDGGDVDEAAEDLEPDAAEDLDDAGDEDDAAGEDADPAEPDDADDGNDTDVAEDDDAAEDDDVAAGDEDAEGDGQDARGERLLEMYADYRSALQAAYEDPADEGARAELAEFLVEDSVSSELIFEELDAHAEQGLVLAEPIDEFEVLEGYFEFPHGQYDGIDVGGYTTCVPEPVIETPDGEMVSLDPGELAEAVSFIPVDDDDIAQATEFRIEVGVQSHDCDDI